MTNSDPSDLLRFPTTQWPLVRQGKAALPTLFARYRPAMVAHLTHVKRFDPHDAEDFVQGFVTTQMLEKDLLAQADETKGRFRTLLLTALDRYILNTIRHGRTKTRRPTNGHPKSLDDHADPVAGNCSESDPFDIEWANQAIKEAVKLMSEYCASNNRPDIWGVFDSRLIRPAFEGVTPGRYRDLCAQFGMETPAQTACLLATGKRMFGRMLRAVIAQYAETEAAIDEEIADLIRILARGTHDRGSAGES